MTLPPTARTHPGAHNPLAAEVAVALTYNGSTEAVLMATPADLEDFAYGFSLTEGLARREEIERVEIVPTELGIDVQLWVHEAVAARLAARRRARVGPVGCGLCGIETLAEAMRQLPGIAPGGPSLSRADIEAAMEALSAAQPIREVTRATHAAGFWSPGRGLVAVREDVGRHNALDKLAGALRGAEPREGAVLMTSRISLDLVQKCTVLGAPILIGVSAPTAAAAEAAEAAGLTLVAPARTSRLEVLTGAARITG
ncbi:formate dehydrogenase accessory sulfurtransferase FdhD [Paracoccus sp. S-4012]|uniref:formate dehydrogenase accessory sulfurtransferase FdhD n=1 Tax=Paracoccus sp. S-4012 TaxID=2665648 RepID=UPI0012B09291|nr:formate dehydrogenase accessory sulfurtransferase FdhD [Paracoccus sp. S-4012]MRX49852.1 formate dehydrogenase accessory sulfurtransferase FdhD [Paracoccus sp. S-4012]